jgi:hypothetical protein
MKHEWGIVMVVSIGTEFGALTYRRNNMHTCQYIMKCIQKVAVCLGYSS